MSKPHLYILGFLLAVVFSGCTAQTQGVDRIAPGSSDGTRAGAGTATTETVPLMNVDPTVFDWSGHVLSSEADNATHFRPTEDVMWSQYRSGFLFEVDETPQAMEVALDWEGSGKLMIMLHSHKKTGTNDYVEHVTAQDYENPKCLRVPTEDIAQGVWQIMVHADAAMQIDFTLRVGLLGGAGHVIEDERHGHYLQDGPSSVDLHEIENCQFLQPAVPTTVPTALPSKTHFEFEESLGCGAEVMTTSVGPKCVEFRAGPGGTGNNVDGHWVELGPDYWHLLLTSTVDQGPTANDSDCVFTDAQGTIVGTADNAGDPCEGLVPERAEWLFVYPYITGALAMTVDFDLPPSV